MTGPACRSERDTTELGLSHLRITPERELDAKRRKDNGRERKKEIDRERKREVKRERERERERENES